MFLLQPETLAVMMVISCFFVATSKSERRLDFSLEQLISNNEKLREINVQRKKVDEFVRRWGYFHGYVLPLILDLEAKGFTFPYEGNGDNGFLLLEADIAEKLEAMNAYLDWVIDTKNMDDIVS